MVNRNYMFPLSVCNYKTTIPKVCFFIAACAALVCLCCPCFRILAAGLAIGNPRVKVYVTKKFEVWLSCLGDEDIEMRACEIFGFNQGAWQEKLTGLILAKHMNE